MDLALPRYEAKLAQYIRKLSEISLKYLFYNIFSVVLFTQHKCVSTTYHNVIFL